MNSNSKKLKTLVYIVQEK